MALTLSEIQSTTQDYWMPGAVDNYYNSNVLTFRLLKAGRTVDGGEKIRQPIWYGSPQGGAFGNNSKFDTTRRDQINAARFDWAYYYEPATYDLQDKVENAGAAQEVDIVMKKLSMTQAAIRESMSDGIYGNGTGAPGIKPITGLLAMLNATSSTAYGGITEDDLPEWAPGATTTTTEGLTLAVMRTLKTACKVGGGPNGGSKFPTLYITTDDLRDKYESLLQPQQRFSDPGLASAGFDNLMFNSKPVVGDDRCPSGYMFALNEEFLEFVSHTNFKFNLAPWMRPTDEYKFTTQLLWVGNLICSRRSAHGFHSNLS
jgi:hypothetical protein